MGVTKSGLKELEEDFQKALEESVERTRGVVSKGALNVKKDAQSRVEGYAHLPHYPRSIGYDTKVSGTLVSAEIGPDKSRKQGPLGTIIENGSVNNAPIPHLAPAIDAEEPRFIKALEDLEIDLLEGRVVRGDAADSG